MKPNELFITAVAKRNRRVALYDQLLNKINEQNDQFKENSQQINRIANEIDLLNGDINRIDNEISDLVIKRNLKND